MSAADTRVHVPLAGRAYDILIGAGALARHAQRIAAVFPARRALLVCDETVARLHADRVAAALGDAGLETVLASFPGGETRKTVATCEGLWAACAAARIDRSAGILALGGGVTGDIAGFVAATWMRGVPLVQLPTTLLAMVDSSVGGKTGVNAAFGKNLIGAFKQPDLVVADTALLATMDAREYRAGLAEVAKYGVIRDPAFFAWQEEHAAALVARDAAAVAHAVAESCRIKAWYVVEDEEEHGVRAELNYGHTFGHALERETGYARYLHGEAVAIGMEMAAALGRRLGILVDDALPARQRGLLEAFRLPLRHAVAAAERDAAISALVDACRVDKKVRSGRMRFLLPRAFGRMEVVADPDPDAVAAAFGDGIDAR